MKKVATVFGLFVGLYFVVRAAVEPFVITMSDPTTYQAGWGGPSLFGVLLVHMGPGVLCAALMVFGVVRAWKKQARAATPSLPGDDVRLG